MSTTFRNFLQSYNGKIHAIKSDELFLKELEQYDFIYIPGNDLDVLHVLDLANAIGKDLNLGVITSCDLKLENYRNIKLNWMQIDPEQIGIAAAKLLLQKIADKTEINGRILIAPQLITHNS